nr:peritrophin-44-like isoform X1 [Penaeus vannamei]
MGFTAASTNELICTGEGRFLYPGSCGTYMDCTPSGDGGYTLVKDNCRGYTFDAARKTCIAKPCESRLKRSVTTINHQYSHLCEGQPDKFICGSCRTLVMCVKGQAFIRHCIPNNFCSTRKKFGGGVCYPEEPVECTCTKANDFMVDHYDPQRFFSCEDIGSIPESYKCPDGMEFDESTAQCRNIGGLPPCSVSGQFANPSNCSEYYSCIALKYGWLQKAFQCSKGLMYNKKTQKCEDPCKYQFVCTQEGRYPDYLNKCNYYECIMLGGNMRQERYQCPKGYKWSEVSPGIGKCVEDDGETDEYPFSHCKLDTLCSLRWLPIAPL